MPALEKSLSEYLFPSRYIPLSQEVKDPEEQTVSESLLTSQLPTNQVPSSPLKRILFSIYTIVALLVVSNLALMGEIARLRTLQVEPCSSNPSGQLLFSPAENVIEYEVIKFHGGPFTNEENDIYSLPPSDEVDKAWRDLYEIGAVEIPLDSNLKLVNKTEMKNTAGDALIVGIDVFHQLHCLNMLRKALYPADYPLIKEKEAVHKMHISHCINSIRQSLQCSSDISVIPFNVHTIKSLFDEPRMLPSFDVVHTCRNFKKIQEWSKERWSKYVLDNE